MEDQPTDSGDLTTPELDSPEPPAAKVPEGKAARRRHRLSRRELNASVTETSTESESSEAASEESAEPEGLEPDASQPDAPETPAAESGASFEPVASFEPKASYEPKASFEPEAALEAEAESAKAEPEAEPVAAEPVEPTAAEQAEPAPAEQPKPQQRRRFGWRRSKAAAPVVEPEVQTEAVEPDQPAEPEAEQSAAQPEQPESADDDTEAVSVDSDEPPPVLESTVDGDEPDASDEPEPVLVPHRTAGRPLKVAAAVAGVLVVAASAFAGATLQPYLADRAAVEIKLDVARTATEAITTLWTYTPDDIDSLGDRAARYLGGDLAAQYRDFIDGIVEANKQAQVTNQTQVVGAAVESLTPTEATALVFTNTTATSPVSRNIPSLRYVSYRLTLERRDQKWLVTKMPNITSLDLTPRL